MPSYSPGDTLLDKYIIQSLLGQGAFGEVYLVTHLMLGVPRAVKVLRSDAPGIGSSDYSEAQSRFRLEAQLGAQIHPHLLLVHDCFISEKISLLEMEYAAGGSLAARLQKAREDKQPFEVEQALRIAAEIAEGLAALHEHDYVHRDLKPSNILFDEHGQARVADLGLTQVPGGPSLRSQLSEPRAHPGTPGYMSPEQENAGKLLKPPSDVYALGLVLFEMLTGRNYSLLKPGTRAASLRKDLPLAADDLLARMLAKSPDERPWDGAETARLLKAVLADLAGAAQRAAQAEVQARNAAEQAQEQARLEAARKAQAEARAREQAEVQAREQARLEEEARIRRLAEQNKWVAPVTPARPVPREQRKGFLARYWGWLALTVLLLGGCFVLLPLLFSLGVLSTPAAAPAIPPTAGPIRPGPTASPAPTAAAIQPSPTASPAIPPYTRPADGMTMLYVPGATFTMGSADMGEATPHQVTLDAYWIDQTDVTNSEYARCVASGGCTEPSYKNSATRPSYYGNSQFDNYPMIYVNWNLAKSYCEWAGKGSNGKVGLPTEAQWELAARGTDGRTYPWAGAAIDKSYANYNRDVGDTSEVCSYPQGNSPYGACDMAGNVLQWVADWYGDYGTSPVSNPSGPDSGTYRVLRGGSWLSNDILSLRSAYRDHYVNPFARWNYNGFRCARSQ